MDPKFTQNFFQNILTTWVNPEIKRRIETGKISGQFGLNKAQVIFTIDGHQIIRLNEEIRATIRTDKRQVDDMSINFDDTNESLQAVDRLKSEDNFGHIAIVKVRDLWTIAFDFRYGTKHSKNYFRLGSEFLEAARHSLTNNELHAAATNLFIAMENLMRARILLYPDEEVRKLKKHGTMASIVNIHFKKGTVVKSEECEAFNELKSIYDKGASRYVPDSKLDPNEIIRLFEVTVRFSGQVSSLYTAKLVYKD